MTICGPSAAVFTSQASLVGLTLTTSPPTPAPFPGGIGPAGRRWRRRERAQIQRHVVLRARVMWGRVTLAADAVHLGPWQQSVASVPVAAGENSRGVDGIDSRTRSTQRHPFGSSGFVRFPYPPPTEWSSGDARTSACSGSDDADMVDSFRCSIVPRRRGRTSLPSPMEPKRSRALVRSLAPATRGGGRVSAAQGSATGTARSRVGPAHAVRPPPSMGQQRRSTRKEARRPQRR